MSKYYMPICRICLLCYLSSGLYTHTHALRVLHQKRIQSNGLEQKGAKGPCLKQGFSLKRSLVCNEPWRNIEMTQVPWLSLSGYKNHPFFAPLPPQTRWPRKPWYLRTTWLVDPSGPWCRSLQCNVRLGSFWWINPYASLQIQFRIFSKHFQTYYLRSICKEGNQQMANFRNTFEAF